jgi:CHAT domain-containing protein
MLLGRLLAGVTEHRMLIIPDGPLNGMPFAAVPIPGESRTVIDRFVIGYAPSLELALEGLSRRDSPSSHRVVIVSDPVYAPDDQRLVIADNGAPGNLRSPRAASPNNLTRLPYSALEARAVEKALGARETLRLDGFDANTSRVLDLAKEKLSVLHFATHAIARKDLPEQSALYLTEYSREGSRLGETRLTANDIARTGLNADVVVLSGCSTGDGSELRGEGVLGLTYGFLANGSGSVVAALWPIEDASTARFMNEFYLAYRESRKTAESLRAAQLRIRDSAKSAVWSSFVVRANGFP